MESSIQLDKIVMERIASASQEKVYPSVQPKSEVSLRRVLLSSRYYLIKYNKKRLYYLSLFPEFGNMFVTKKKD
jgi:hypothetical protein